jgi:uncharacterized protein (DUF3084 family)
MEEVRKNSGQTLAIVALVTAIVTFLMAVVPCIGVIAIVPGIIAVVVASIGLSHARRRNEPTGVLTAGLIIGIVASPISFSQIFIAGKLAKRADHQFPEIQNIINDVKNDIMKDLEDSDIHIKIESGDDKIEINTEGKSNKDENLKRLQELESDSTGTLKPEK